MAIDKITYAAAKKYTDKTVAGGGAIKGKNCVVDSIMPITGGNRVTFKWTLDDGTVQTNYMDVMDGVDGADGTDGLGIASADIDASNHLIITYDDGRTHDAGEIQVTGQTIQRNVLPSPSLAEKGNIYQYIGATDANYTNGYFYQCVDDGGVYKWENKKVQSGGGSGVDNFKDLDDVNFGTLTDGDLPQYNQASGKWENSNQIPLGIQHLQGSMANLQIAIHNLDLLVASKVDKQAGKDLSSNDYTNADKEKVTKLQPIYLIGSGLNLDGSVLKATGMSIPIDQHLDPTSANPVQNKAIAVPVQALQGSMSQVRSDLADKVDKEAGKGLSEENFSSANKTALETTIPLQISQLQGSLATKADTSSIPTKLSQLTNDDNYVQDSSYVHTDNNYSGSDKSAVQTTIPLQISQLQGSLATKASQSTTYTKTEVDNLISAVSSLDIKVVSSLPTTNISTSTIYLLAKSTAQTKNVYDEYINLDGTTSGWEKIGDTEIDLSNYIQKSSTAGLVKNDGTIDTNTYLTTHQDITGKADKVASAVSGNFAGLDSNGNLTDSGKKPSDFLTSHQSLANYYATTDTAETNLDDADSVPFYDNSATAKRRSTWANIKAKLKAYFDTLYTGNAGTVTSVGSGTGLTGGPITGSGSLSLATSGVTAGTKGPTADVTGTDGTTIKVPKITVDQYGRVTALDEKTLTNKNTTYSSQAEAAGGTAVSLVTTGEKYTWNGRPRTYRKVITSGIGASGIGTWSDAASPTESDWISWDILKNLGTNNYDVSLKFDPSSGEPITLGGYIIDTTTGKMCIKFGNSIATPANAKVAIDVTYMRNDVS